MTKMAERMQSMGLKSNQLAKITGCSIVTIEKLKCGLDVTLKMIELFKILDCLKLKPSVLMNEYKYQAILEEEDKIRLKKEPLNDAATSRGSNQNI